MSSQINAIFSTSFQKSIISGNVNSNILLLFLSGGYIGLYMFTLRIYAFTSHPRKQTITLFLTVLFTTTLGQLIIVWYSTSICFLGAANSRVDAFILTFGSSSVIGFLFGLMRGINLIIADALLIWRCYHILLAQWRYLRIGLLSLYAVEVVLVITGIVLNSLFMFRPGIETGQFVHQYNVLQGIGMLVTVVTSVLATSVIGARIYASTALSHGARGRYMHIVDIIAQSSALYSISIAVDAVTALLNNGKISSMSSTVLNAGFYANTIAAITPAFAPTLMVARLELSKDKANAEFSTDATSESQDAVLNIFPVVLQETNPSEIEEISRRSIPGAIRIVEV